MYISYTSALEMSGLKQLSDRREDRCLDFAKKCVKHPKNKRLFPLRNTTAKNIRREETFEVNFASGEKYLKSAIPYCQRLLNEKS